MVMLIDDDEATLFALASRLTHRGYGAVAAGDAEEALDLLATQPARPAAIGLDWKLRKVGGSEVLRAIGSDDRLARVPVIVYGGYLDEGVDREAMSAGATECVAKGAWPGED